ncbi:MAG: beta family protein [Terriglobia bacterium]
MKDVPRELEEVVDAVLAYRPQNTQRQRPRGYDMAFGYKHYVPILKGKAGELDALAKTPPKSRTKFTPLVEVPPIPPSWPDDSDEPVPSRKIDQHVNSVVTAFKKSLPGFASVWVDGFYIETEDALEDGSSPIDVLFAGLRDAGIDFVPVVGLDRVKDYIQSVQSAVELDGRGCCIRLVESDLEGIADLEKQVTSLLKELGVKSKTVDLLVDFASQVPSKSALPYQIDDLPLLSEWRTLTVASSAFPIDLSGLKTNSVTELDRQDWLVWTSLPSHKKGVKRMPSYGDYAINHPTITEIDPRIMQMSPNIRYSGPQTFVIAKGQAIPRKPKKGVTDFAAQEKKREALLPAVQYPKLADAVMKHSAWKGNDFSWGDKFIADCAQKEAVGNATTWRTVGTSHHIALVVQQIASLP